MANRAKKDNRLNYGVQIRYNKMRAKAPDGWKWDPLPKGWKKQILKAKKALKKGHVKNEK